MNRQNPRQLSASIFRPLARIYRSRTSWGSGAAFLFGIIFIAVAAPASADEKLLAGSQALIQELALDAIETLTVADLPNEDRDERFRSLLEENFAVTGIARFALGRHWRSASEQERGEYVQLFQDVIVATWAGRFSEYAGQEFDVLTAEAVDAAGDEKVAVVHSIFFTDPETPVTIDWRVGSDGQLYRVTDVVIEGVSMALTYRDEFASVVRKDGLGGLLTNLRNRAEGNV